MSSHYNQNYTLEQVEDILKIIQDCVKGNCYVIALNKNRIENIEFVDDYKIRVKDRKNILLSITSFDFCHSLQNKKAGYMHENLFVFCPKKKLNNSFGGKELVDIYIKFNIIEHGIIKRVVAISFHKRNKPIKYLFKKN